jgi:hydrogenase nickel incorporation protein HypA/HybF
MQGRPASRRLIWWSGTCYTDDSVQFYFDFLSQGTLAEGAALRFRRQPGEVTCRDCGHVFAATVPLVASCPGCGGQHLSVSGGREFRVESIEVDYAGNSAA